MENNSIKFPITVTKNLGRKSGYTASYGPWQSTYEAHGETAAEAKENLTGALVLALHTIRTAEPQFAAGDDDALHVAVPAFDGGSTWYRVTDRATLTTYSINPADHAFNECVGMTIIPAR